MPSFSGSPPVRTLPPSSRAILDVAEVLLELLLADRRPDLRLRIERVADPQRPRLLGQRFDEAVVNAFGDDDPRRRRAALAGGEECAVDGARDRAVEVGVVEHDERVLAAHLELHARLALRRAFGDARADALRAGERDPVDASDDRRSRGRRRLRRSRG